MTITATAPRATAYRGRLRWWTELPLIAVVYGLYSAGRLFVRGDMGTANHYLLDAVAGAAVMAIGYALAQPALRLIGDARVAVTRRRSASPSGSGSGSASGSVVVATSLDVTPAAPSAAFVHHPPAPKR